MVASSLSAGDAVVPSGGRVRVHSVIGFDESSVLHCIGYAAKLGRVERVTLYRPRSVEPHLEKRSRIAAELVAGFVRSFGGGVEEVVLEELSPTRVIPAMRRRVEDDLASPGVALVACLSSGMRLLVLSLYTALLAQPPEVHGRVYLYVAPEGRPEEAVILPLSDITRILMPFVMGGRDPVERSVVEVLLEKEAASFSEILREVEARLGRSVARSTLYRTLQRLVKTGLLEKDARGVYRLKLGVIEGGSA